MRVHFSTSSQDLGRHGWFIRAGGPLAKPAEDMGAPPALDKVLIAGISVLSKRALSCARFFQGRLAPGKDSRRRRKVSSQGWTSYS